MKMLINGKWVDSAQNKTIQVLNPYTNEVIDTIPAATKEQVDEAVAYAVAAQKEWAACSVYERVAVMKKFIALLGQNIEEIAQMVTAEIGKPIRESRLEVYKMRNIFEAFCEAGLHLEETMIPAGAEPNTKGTVLLTARQPLGVIGAIIPFNFPCWSFSVKTAPAIVAGNAVVVKPSTDAPLAIGRLAELMVEAGLPAGVIQIVTGRGSQVGTWLCSNKDVRGITLTGSSPVGVQTARTAAEHLAHVTLELGGNDACIILNDADIATVLQECIPGRLGNNGQVCCAPKRFLVQSGIKDVLTKILIEKVGAIPWLRPTDPESFSSCLVTEKAARDVEEQVNLTVKQGAKIALGGKREGAYYSPTILTDVTRDMDIAKDMEVFGPVIPIIEVKDLDDALSIANASNYGLNGCIFTKDMKSAARATREMQCGSVVVNGSSFFNTMAMAFGGTKNSGIGREGISTSFDEVTQMKTVVLKDIF